MQNAIETNLITSMPKVILEEGLVAALSHTYAVKSPLVTMAHSKFAPKSIPSRGSIPKLHYLPHPWTRPTYDAKRHPDPIRRFSTLHWTDRRTDPRTYGPTHRPTDRPRESLMTISRCATRATRPKIVKMRFIENENLNVFLYLRCGRQHATLQRMRENMIPAAQKYL